MVNKTPQATAASARLFHIEPMRIHHPTNLNESLALLPELGVTQIKMGQNKTKKSIKERRAENRKHKRESLLRSEGRLVDGVEIPRGSLPGDPSKQNYEGGYSAHYFYKDIEYKCAGCGKEGVWTAQQQKKYYETQKGNIYNQPKWCHDCHKARMEEKYNKQKM